MPAVSAASQVTVSAAGAASDHEPQASREAEHRIEHSFVMSLSFSFGEWVFTKVIRCNRRRRRSTRATSRFLYISRTARIWHFALVPRPLRQTAA
jgi:hypothetical protein